MKYSNRVTEFCKKKIKKNKYISINRIRLGYWVRLLETSSTVTVETLQNIYVPRETHPPILQRLIISGWKLSGLVGECWPHTPEVQASIPSVGRCCPWNHWILTLGKSLNHTYPWPYERSITVWLVSSKWLKWQIVQVNSPGYPEGKGQQVTDSLDEKSGLHCAVNPTRSEKNG